MRQGSLDGSNLTERLYGTSGAVSAVDRLYGTSGAGAGQGLTRPTSETNLRQLAYGDPVPVATRPGSALGLLQGSSIVNANGMRSSTNNRAGYISSASMMESVKAAASKQDQSLTESLAAILPPDLRHLLGTTSATGTTSSSAIDTTSALHSVRIARYLRV